jgi:phosphoglucosamine mutase
MIRHRLNLGGEQSGHLIFRDFITTGDGLVAALQILAVVSRTKKPLSELRQVLKKLPQLKRDMRVLEKIPIDQFPSLAKLLSESESQLVGKGRILLRYSGTEPKIRLLVEGPEPSILERIADRIVAEVTRNLGA